VKKEIVVNVGEHEIRIAVLEDEKLVELHVERPEDERMVGDMYNAESRPSSPECRRHLSKSAWRRPPSCTFPISVCRPRPAMLGMTSMRRKTKSTPRSSANTVSRNIENILSVDQLIVVQIIRNDRH